MNVLAMDSSSSLLGIALQTEQSYHESNTDIGLHHTENLTRGVDLLLTRAEIRPEDLDLIVVTRGPGSFTGLRIGMAAGKGLAFALHIPLVSVPSLDVWSMGKEYFPGVVLPVLDARKQRVYTAFFEKGRRSSDYLDISPLKLLEECKNHESILLTGPYAPRLRELWRASEENTDVSIILDPQYGSPHTWELLQLGILEFQERGADSETEGPLYLRPSEAELSLREKNKNDGI